MPALASAEMPAGFHGLTTPQAARRQLAFSLTVVALLAIGILAAALAVDEGAIVQGGTSALKTIMADQASERALARDPRR